jgi:predicted dehydrogenase
MTYRAALIGCGKIGSAFDDEPRAAGVRSHAGAYAACAETTLVAVCDADAYRARRCAERWRVPGWYVDAAPMLAEERPELVSVCTPDASHYEVLRTVLAAGGVRAVLAEKPLALRLEQAQEAARAAAERGVVLAVNYTRRYAAGHLALWEGLRAGGIGDVQAVSGFYTKGVLHNGTHWFDLARFLVGPVLRVQGYDRLHEGGDDPTLDAALEFEGGARGYLHGCDAARFSVFELDVVGTRGRVRVTDSGHVIDLYEVVDSAHYRGYRTLGLEARSDGGLADALACAVRDLVRCLERGASPRCGAADAVEALRIALAVRQSARSGRPICLGGG